ncbi:hypothetical protein KR018_009309 [Drosophila ironensis]|nr:hypothetical protein KR018_009309 [Drosophila ironensis]
MDRRGSRDRHILRDILSEAEQQISNGDNRCRAGVDGIRRATHQDVFGAPACNANNHNDVIKTEGANAVKNEDMVKKPAVFIINCSESDNLKAGDIFKFENSSRTYKLFEEVYPDGKGNWIPVPLLKPEGPDTELEDIDVQVVKQEAPVRKLEVFKVKLVRKIAQVAMNVKEKSDGEVADGSGGPSPAANS